MGKQFKFRLSRVIPSFNTCRSKDSLALPSNPDPLFLLLSPVNPHPHHRPTPKPSSSSIKRHMSSAISSLACGCRPRSSTDYVFESEDTESPVASTPKFHWEKEDRFHVVALAKIFTDYESPHRQKIYNSSASDGDYEDVILPAKPSHISEKKKKRRAARKKKNRTRPLTLPARARMCPSLGVDSKLFLGSHGVDNDDDGLQELDSCDSEEQTETLISTSRTSSTDEYSSSESFNPQLQTIRERRALTTEGKKMEVKEAKRCVLRTTGKEKDGNNRKTNGTSSGLCLSSNDESEIDTPARLSMFLKRLMPCAVEGKVRDSFAVVKKSEYPFEDFKESMLEMILEKEMFDERDLEQLLECFLSLNSRKQHATIVNAFYEIWDTLFLRRSTH